MNTSQPRVLDFRMASSSPLVPTFYGHIASTQDALVLFEACLSGSLNHVARRPHDRERASLIKSGNVFIYEEHSSGIKRWTDGVPWSPSRILGNFLVYRELERPFPPGEKKRAMKRSKKSPPAGILKHDSYPSSNSSMSTGYNAGSTAASSFDSPASSISKETERSLIGSLVDSYGFKDDGLVKKTVSVTIGRVSHHLVSYYTIADVMNNKFSTPSKDPRFQHIQPRPDLVTKQNFRTPVDEVDSVEDRPSVYTTYQYPRNGGYEVAPQGISSRQMSLPNPPLMYSSAQPVYNHYGVQPPVPFDGLGQGQLSNSYNPQYTQQQDMYQTPKVESYDMNNPGANSGYRPPQRWNSVIGINSQPARDEMSPSSTNVSTNFSRRGSNYEQPSPMQRSPNDSGFGTIPSPSESKPASDMAYPHPGYYSHTNSSQNYNVQRSLPIPVQQGQYERPPAPAYAAVDNANMKNDNVWPIGNSSAGHGHYVSAQEHWTNTSSS